MVPVGGGLNEVQLPKELQLAGLVWIVGDRVSLNEVQLPKELQPCKTSLCSRFVCLNEVQLPKELQHPLWYAGGPDYSEPQ